MPFAITVLEDSFVEIRTIEYQKWHIVHNSQARVVPDLRQCTEPVRHGRGRPFLSTCYDTC